MRAAKEEAARAQKALEEAENDKRKAMEAKQDLLDQIERHEASVKLAEEAAANAAKK